MFIDTHCHLGMMVQQEEKKLSEEQLCLIDKIIDNVCNENVKIIINIGASACGSYNSILLAQRYQSVFATIGIHPCDCDELWLKELVDLEAFLKNKKKYKIVGIGETGLDFYHKPFNKERQKDAFKAHIELALNYTLPLVVHAREASDDVLKILEPYIKHGLTGVLHCFSHEDHVAQQLLDWNFYIGIDGHITYPKNNELRAIIKRVPLNKLLLETDAPFLPPQQFRGKQNSPRYIPLIAQFIAAIREINVQEVAQQTTANAYALFKFDTYEISGV